MHIFISRRYFSDARSRGFTLIELLVVSGIITIITTLILSRHSQFSSTVLLRSLAYDVALSVRQAQVYELSTREVVAGSGEFGGGYGVHFSAATPSAYTLFGDIDKDGVYDPDDGDGILESGEDQNVEVFSVRQGYGVASFCAFLLSGAKHCAPCTDGCSAEITEVDVSFLRPNPDAVIKTDLGAAYSSAIVTVESPGGNRRDIGITSTGQISVSEEAESFAQSGYYSYAQSTYYAYGQSTYYSYAQSTYYSYAQSTYYSYGQSAYYSYAQSSYYSYAQSTYYSYAESFYGGFF